MMQLTPRQVVIGKCIMYVSQTSPPAKTTRAGTTATVVRTTTTTSVTASLDTPDVDVTQVGFVIIVTLL